MSNVYVLKLNQAYTYDTVPKGPQIVVSEIRFQVVYVDNGRTTVSDTTLLGVSDDDKQKCNMTKSRRAKREKHPRSKYQGKRGQMSYQWIVDGGD